MPNPRRRERLASLIEQIVSELLVRDIKDPRIGFTSITAVEVTPDVSHAKIFVSVMGSEEERSATMRALTHATGFVRSKLGEELTIRHVPEISVQLDRSIERGDHVLALINKISAERAAADGAAAPAKKAPARTKKRSPIGDS